MHDYDIQFNAPARHEQVECHSAHAVEALITCRQTCSYMPAKPSHKTLSRGGAYLATLQCSCPSAIWSTPSRLKDPLQDQRVSSLCLAYIHLASLKT